jgi:hypothetical protein
MANPNSGSSPNWPLGFVPTPAQWSAAFAGKVDYDSLGAAAFLNAGGANGAAVFDALGNASSFNVIPAGQTTAISLANLTTSLGPISGVKPEALVFASPATTSGVGAFLALSGYHLADAVDNATLALNGSGEIAVSSIANATIANGYFTGVMTGGLTGTANGTLSLFSDQLGTGALSQANVHCLSTFWTITANENNQNSNIFNVVNLNGTSTVREVYCYGGQFNINSTGDGAGGGLIFMVETDNIGTGFQAVELDVETFNLDFDPTSGNAISNLNRVLFGMLVGMSYSSASAAASAGIWHSSASTGINTGAAAQQPAVAMGEGFKLTGAVYKAGFSSASAYVFPFMAQNLQQRVSMIGLAEGQIIDWSCKNTLSQKLSDTSKNNRISLYDPITNSWDYRNGNGSTVIGPSQMAFRIPDAGGIQTPSFSVDSTGNIYGSNLNISGTISNETCVVASLSVISNVGIYTSVPSITISAPPNGGTTATSSCLMSAVGNAISITSGSATIGATLTLQGGTGTAPTFTYCYAAPTGLITQTSSSNGQIINQGTGYDRGAYLQVNGGTVATNGSPAIFYATQDSGNVVSLIMMTPGAYTVLPSNPVSFTPVPGQLGYLDNGTGLTADITWINSLCTDTPGLLSALPSMPASFSGGSSLVATVGFNIGGFTGLSGGLGYTPGVLPTATVPTGENGIAALLACSLSAPVAGTLSLNPNGTVTIPAASVSALILALMESLPTTLPGSANQLWLNGRQLAIS